MLSEQDVDRELQAALSVSPSADFEARVLRRVDADRPSWWPSAYGWVAAAASVAIVTGVFYALNRTSPAVAPPPPTQVVEQVPRGGVVGAVREPARIDTVRAARSALRSAPRTAEPEVLVPPNQMEAVRRLVRAVNEGGVEAPPEPRQGPMAPPAKLDVALLVVEPVPLPPLVPVTETPASFIRSLK